MLASITKALKRFEKEHLKEVDSPLIYIPPHKGAKTKHATIEDESARDCGCIFVLCSSRGSDCGHTDIENRIEKSETNTNVKG